MNRNFTPHFLYFDVLPSTNTEALRQAKLGTSEGLCIIAREQTAGRGRLDRTWTSRRDAGLYLSVLLRPRQSFEHWPIFTLMTAVAAHEALSDLIGFNTDIKWPNDIMASGKKLAGILAETAETPVGPALVIGIGVNVQAEAVPEKLRETATSIAIELEEPGRSIPSARELANEIVDKMMHWYPLTDRPGGSAAVVSAWTARSSYARGKAISVVSGSESLRGITDGLTEHGALRLITEKGATRTLYSAEVSAVRS